LRTYNGVVAPGLWRLRELGYRVYSVKDLRKTGYPGAARGEIYAVFEVEEDAVWEKVAWDGVRLMEMIERFESTIHHRLPQNLGRTSPYPRVLPLRDLLKARV